MHALELLTGRVSVAKLVEPAPTQAQREVLFAAALRAPDHGQLRPWRFLTIEGAARERFGQVLEQALKSDPKAGAVQIEKARNAPLRAPLLVVVIAKNIMHPKVPVSEQHLSAACCAHALLLAAQAQGLGAMWRTGELAYHPQVAQALGLSKGEQVLGFIYLGTPEGEPHPLNPLDPADFVAPWLG